MPHVPPTQPSLLVRLKDAHDREAWERFVDLYAPLVYAFVRKRGLQDADAADLTQDVMRQVALAAHSLEYDPKRGSFRGWLFTVVQSRLTDHWRREGLRERGTGDTDAQHRLNELPQPGGLDASERSSLALAMISNEFGLRCVFQSSPSGMLATFSIANKWSYRRTSALTACSAETPPGSSPPVGACSPASPKSDRCGGCRLGW